MYNQSAPIGLDLDSIRAEEGGDRKHKEQIEMRDPEIHRFGKDSLLRVLFLWHRVRGTRRTEEGVKSGQRSAHQQERRACVFVCGYLLSIHYYFNDGLICYNFLRIDIENGGFQPIFETSVLFSGGDEFKRSRL